MAALLHEEGTSNLDDAVIGLPNMAVADTSEERIASNPCEHLSSSFVVHVQLAKVSKTPPRPIPKPCKVNVGHNKTEPRRD